MESAKLDQSLPLQQPFVNALVISQHVSRLAVDIFDTVPN